MNFLRRAGGAFAAIGAVLAKELGPREIGLVLGLLLVAYGAGTVWLPAGFLIPGAVLLYVSIFGLKS